jgi:glucokinase
MPTPPASSSSSRCLLAVEIGGTKTQAVAGTADGRIVDRRRFRVDRDRGAAGIRDCLAEAVTGLAEQWRPAAVGVGFGGPVDWRTGRIAHSHQVAGWDGFPLADWLAKRAGAPAFVENDANTAALGEARHGAGRGHDPVLYVTIGSGVGGGLVCGGGIYHGAAPGEVEIGHLRLDAEGRTTEALCSGWSLDARIRAAVAAVHAGELARLVRADPGHEARHLGPALAAGDGLAAAILDEAAGWLALALSHATHLLHPEIVVLGGGVALVGEPLRAAVARHLARLVMDAFAPGPRVALAALGEDAVPVGGLALAEHRLGTASSSS